MERRIVSGITLGMLFISMLTLAFSIELWPRMLGAHDEQQLAVVAKSPMSLESSAEIRFAPQKYTFIKEKGIGAGFQFNTTIELYDVAEMSGWQAWVYFNNTLLNATNVYYYPDEPIHTVSHMPVSPVIDNEYNATHGYVQHGIMAFYPDHVNVIAVDYPLGIGVCIVEFEVLMKPGSGKTLESNLALNNPDTYLLLEDQSTEISCSKKNGLYRLISADIRVPTDYSTIQAAINAANPGNTIFVYNGTYHENPVVNKTLLLIGQSVTAVTINGSGGTVMYIEGVDDVIIDGFTIISGADGVYLYNSNGATLSECFITGNSGHGIYARALGGNCDGLTVYDNSISGNGGKGIFAYIPLDHGQYRTCNGWTIHGNNITDNNGNGVHARTYYMDVICNNWAIHDNNIASNGGHGIYAQSAYGAPNYPSTGCNNWVVCYNDVVNNTGHGVYAYAYDSCTCHSWIVRDNNLTHNSGDGIRTESIPIHPNRQGHYYYWIVSDNNIFDNTGAGIRTYQFANSWSISDNDISENWCGMSLGGENNILRNNMMSNSTHNFGVSGTGIHDIDVSNNVNGKPIYYWVNRQEGEIPADAGYIALVDSANIVVRDFNLSHNEQGILLIRTDNITLENFYPTNNIYGIYVQESRNYALRGYEIVNHTYGIYVVQSENMTLAEVKATNNIYGIYLQTSANITVYGSKVANNTYGVFLESSSNCCIYDNEATNNTRAIYITGSHNCSIYNNDIERNDYGLHLSSSSNNTIYRNNFDQNTQQAAMDGAVVNVWDEGYPSGGNYWSDHTGPDECKGTIQNETGSDGIVDTPYFIDENNVDNYPLSAPWSSPIHIIMPGNTTYRTNHHLIPQNITLAFTVKFNASWIGYSLDGHANVTITGNTTLASLSCGSHYIIVYANDTFSDMYPSAEVHFTVTFLTDLNYDKKVDIKDLAKTTYAYGSLLGDSRWNVVADVNRDGIIDIEDVAMVANDYGKTWS